MIKNKEKDNRAEAKQYKHDSPENFVLRMYKKYALATAMEVVVTSKIERALLSPISKGNFFPPNCRPSVATAPYASIPIKGRGTPDKCKMLKFASSFTN